MPEILTIDGGHLEAGGQIVRTAIGLSCVTGKPVKIFNIRKGRPVPGLKAQHLKGIEAAAKLCNAQVKGLKIGSQEIEFYPKEISEQKLQIDVGTAGSVTLVLQTLMIPAVVAGKELIFEITGGSHVNWSPTTGYFRHVFCEFIGKMGANVESETLSYGFYPKGGGKIMVIVKPSSLLIPVSLTSRGKHVFTEGWSSASKDLVKNHVAERQMEAAEKVLGEVKKSVKYVPSLSPGSAITLVSFFGNCFLGASSIGERGKGAEKVGQEAASLLKRNLDSGACLDEWMADQILPYLALAKGKSEVSVARVTQHAKTNMSVIERFLDVKFKVKGNRIECNGQPG
ncbi:MAG: RNA 3'-terminal phosphate cyclase [Candidatus Aenigmarchaeota archaeon]|nr:RNA 3'-terminal phosphate cyclase [Candidatus Aenigmarchaeota archaeon]